MDVKICLLVLFVALAVGQSEAQVSQKGGNCPLRDTISKCTPRCVSDHQCSFNQKCCSNKCGSMSCASPSAVSTGNSGTHKDQGVYCEGRKCGPYEKCEFDKNTKRQKCVRT